MDRLLASLFVWYFLFFSSLFCFLRCQVSFTNPLASGIGLGNSTSPVSSSKFVDWLTSMFVCLFYYLVFCFVCLFSFTFFVAFQCWAPNLWVWLARLSVSLFVWILGLFVCLVFFVAHQYQCLTPNLWVDLADCLFVCWLVCLFIWYSVFSLLFVPVPGSQFVSWLAGLFDVPTVSLPPIPWPDGLFVGGMWCGHHRTSIRVIALITH